MDGQFVEIRGKMYRREGLREERDLLVGMIIGVIPAVAMVAIPVLVLGAALSSIR